jgi:two-component system CheB/CheR fusion protein
MSEKQEPDGARLVVEAADEKDQTAAANMSVVAIGASAGGLEAFRLLLSGLPVDTGFAFVLVQHLDPTHPSSLSEILGRSTKMPVTDASDGLPIERNHVYVIPPNTELTMENRVLKVNPRRQTSGAHLPIDHFLRSLAQDCGANAIGVILSGAGGDGSEGLQAVKEAGGVTFAQEPGTAEFPSMPQRAEAATNVDFVLPPAEIARELARIAKHPHFVGARTAVREDAPEAPSAGLDVIFTVMHEATGIDFSLYREKTVQRRVMRRLALRNVPNLEEYTTRLREDADERSALQKDLLISVTGFFREPDSFEALKKQVFPGIVLNRPSGAPIRIWVPGCASGEEAYSIAISLQEYLKDTGVTFPVQIFASDVSEVAIEKARSGKYAESCFADMSPERLATHFTKVEGGYQIAKSVREQCVFSRHNLIDDPPFAKLDLISCRNVLIYLGAVQEQIIAAFHYALKPGGFLTLGASETAKFDDMFAPIDDKQKIYVRRDTARRPRTFHVHGGIPLRNADTGKAVARGQIAERPNGDMGRAVDRILLSKYSPAAVLVDEGLEVLEIRGDASQFLKLAAGKASYHLLKLILDTGLFLEIEKLVHQAAESGEGARRARVPYDSSGKILEADLEVTQVRGRQTNAYLILIEPVQTEQASAGQSPGQRSEHGEIVAERDRQVAKLKNEVAEARQRLLSLLEEHQATDEESQSATEEAQSSNEELQSLNEEMETAKEELQSTNEELITINSELESKNAALAESRTFAMSIVETVRVPLMVLDSEFRVKTVNESFSKTFHIGPQDAEGQLLASLGGGSWDIPGLRDVLARVLPARKSFDKFEVEREFPGLGTKMLVMNGCRLEHLDLILLAIDDVTVRVKAEKALRESREAALAESRTFAMSIVETVRVPLMVLDSEFRIRAINESFSKTFQIGLGEAEGQLLSSLSGGGWDIPGLRDVLARILPARKSFENFEVQREFPGLGAKTLVMNGCQLEHLDLILLAIDDVTVRVKAEKALHDSQDALRQSQKMEAVGRLAGGIAHDFNNLLTIIIGYSRLAADSVSTSHEVIEYVTEIEKAGQRAAALTDQLLAFSRRKLLQPKVFDVNTVVADFERMMRRTVSERIKIVVRPASDLWRVRADPGEIGRVLMNLCLNARDAMPSGGTLTIQTANVAIEEAEAHVRNLEAGQYVEVTIRDTGIGMDAETQSHVFEPFFTTKDPGKGTGLGLATVLGIMEQSGGGIWCQSELGLGTKFRMLLPAMTAVSDLYQAPTGGLAEAPKGSAEVVLLVEDEDMVRKLTCRILRSQGYTVLEARDGAEGLSVCVTHQGKVDLLISDIVMPEMGGRELVEHIQKIRPGIKVLFMSGHTQDVILKEGVKTGTPFLQKPFAPVELAHKVREVLDAKAGSQGAGK